MVAVKAIREAFMTTEPHTRRNSLGDPHIPRQAGPMLSQLVVNWKVPDGYVELLNFKMEVAGILQMKVYDLNDEEKVPIIKKLARLRRAAIHTDSY